MEDLNMKKKIYSGIFMISLALSGAIYAACEDIDELPPQSDTNFINKTYKLPGRTGRNRNTLSGADKLAVELGDNKADSLSSTC